jgi:uridine monophosphate synthetase
MTAAASTASGAEGTAVDGALAALRRPFAEALHRVGALRFGAFTLKDGSTSPVYCDLRLLIADPAALRLAGEVYAALLARLDYDLIAAIPYAGLPLGTAAALAADRPMVFPRKEAKGYGAGNAVEGRFEAGQTAVVLDDLISSGLSKLEAIASLQAAGLRVRDVVVLVDRRRPGSDDLDLAGYALHAAFGLAELAGELAAAGRIDAAAADRVAAFLGAQAPSAPDTTSGS